MPVGDIMSKDIGSGARYNDGKPDWSLLPLLVVSQYLGEDPWTAHGNTHALTLLGVYQQRADSSAMLFGALDALGGCKPAQRAALMDETARVFTYGAKKYAEWNWAKGMAWSIPLACAARHIRALIAGEENDAESGLPHRAHAACNILMLAYFRYAYPEGDDLGLSKLMETRRATKPN